jgi:hypothetical protein
MKLRPWKHRFFETWQRLTHKGEGARRSERAVTRKRIYCADRGAGSIDS